MSTPSHASSSSRDETLLGDGAPRLGPPELRLDRGAAVARYLLIDELGRGSMGRVYSAYDPDLDRRIALKLVAQHGDRQRERFLREAKAMARIDHPHVIAVHDAGVHEDWMWVAMALIDGPSLDAWLRGGDRTRREVLDVMIGAGRGLEAAHRAGVVHRDFKPANVLVGSGGVAKVGDFGLAGIDEPTTGSEQRPGRAIGTPAYMSPEHLEGVGIDARSDQFSFCVALAEAMLGERPFVGDTLPELARRIVHGELSPKVAHVRGRLGRVVRRGLSPAAADRYPSMAELLDELERTKRGKWSTWAAVGLGGTIAASAWVLATKDDAACKSGSARVEAFWDGTAPTFAAGSYTDEFIAQVRDRYVTAVDAYAQAWVAAYDATCARVGPDARDGTEDDRRAAECVDNRLASLQGLVELTRAGTTEADRVGALLEALPDIADCSHGAWIPYPADPERAAAAVGLHRRLDSLQWTRIADARARDLGEVRAVEAAARELGDPYVLALALRELGRAEADVADDERSTAHLDEALHLALLNGYDRLAAQFVNDALIAANHRSAGSRDLIRLAVLGLALAERTHDDVLTGHLLLNRGHMLRRLEDPAAGRASLLDAVAHYERAGAEAFMWRARLSELIARVELGEVDSALRDAQDMRSRVAVVLGADAREAFVADEVLWVSLTAAGRFREALEVARASLAHARTIYRSGSHMLHNAAWANAVAAVRLGLVDEAASCMEIAAHPSRRDRGTTASLRAWIALSAGDTDEAARILDEALTDESTRAIALVGNQRAQLHLIEGEVAEARVILERPELETAVIEADDTAIDYAIAAMIAGVPHPTRSTWTEFVAAHVPSTLAMQWLFEAAQGMTRGKEGVAAVVAVRDRLAKATFEQSPEVRLLDVWLARQRG